MGRTDYFSSFPDDTTLGLEVESTTTHTAELNDTLQSPQNADPSSLPDHQIRLPSLSHWLPTPHTTQNNQCLESASATSVAHQPRTETQTVQWHNLPKPLACIETLYSSRQTTYINSPEQLHLFRHFQETVARNLDITDAACRFANEVPLRAQENPVLAYAVMAASARHLSQSTDFPESIADRYHQQCLEILIPFLDDATAVLSEILLSTIVILRYLEEIDVSAAFNPSHRIGTRALINLQTHNSLTTDLRSAAFWLGVRQEVYYAIANQKPTSLRFAHDENDAALEPTHDGAWANRMVMHCVGVVNYCFGSHEDATDYESLLEYCKTWISSLPSSYRPIIYRDPGQGNAFSEIAYLSSASVVGLQHYHLASMLLCAHDPRVPRVGIARMSASQAVDDELRSHARMVCGLAVSNENIAPSFVNASMAISLAGGLFRQDDEREACLAILQKCQGLGWPTEDIEKQLRLAWR
ncbi:hypothetical protein KCU86_g3293, partial [Aureobasidium melanogenum]